MSPTIYLALSRFRRFSVIGCLLVISASALAQPHSAEALRGKYAALTQRLQQNQFGRPLVLDSSEAANQLKGDVYAVIDHSFATVSSRLAKPQHWCDVMILHINTKSCQVEGNGADTSLQVHIGKKIPQDLDDVPRVDFKFRAPPSTPEYFYATLDASDGPMGTSDYHIRLEAIPVGAAKTFVHLGYAYRTNLAGNLAMQTYLNTVGRHKVGFTIIGARENGEPEYIGGMRGVIERNAMRYYLAIDAFLDATRVASAMQAEKSLQQWFSATERYPRQLREIDRVAYLEMKRAELLRQQGL